jgi:hypothetical protein
MNLKYLHESRRRIKDLEHDCKLMRDTLNKLGVLQMGELDYTKDFFEICKTEIRDTLSKLKVKT